MDFNDDRIDDYILGRLDDAEKEKFSGEMEKDQFLRADVVLTGEIAAALGRREEKIAKIKKWNREVVARKRLRRAVWTVSVAACVLVMFGIWWPYSYYGLQDRDFLTSRGSGDIYESLWKSKNYGQALSSVDSLMLSTEKEIALLSEKENLTLQESYHLDYIRLRQYELKWTRIQTLLKMREYSKAADEVASFALLEGPYQDKARKLEKKLKIRRRR